MTTRQILPYNNTSGSFLSMLNLVIAYGIGPWIILGYVRRISKDITSTDSFVKMIIQFTIIIQFLLLVLFTLIFVEFYILTIVQHFFHPSAFAISTISASFIMGFTALKFFLWFRLSNRNITILVYALAASSLAICNDNRWLREADF